MADNPYRLPRSVIPSRYDITLVPDLSAATFSGAESVAIEVLEPTDSIVLNSHEIEIQSAKVRRGDLTIEAAVSYEPEAQRARLAFNQTLGPGPGELDLEFTGLLNDQLVGFYKSTFTDVDGNEQPIATTQFEATDARRAFPCWDEPDLKAVFGITLVVPADLFAVSNGPEVARNETEDGKRAVRFADTMKMSTYLVAFAVGPFEATDPVDVDGVPVRIIAPRGKLELTGFALECAQFCFRYLRDYYGIPYPGLKIDHIAIPDFAFGAMENLGLITYRETALLLDTATASQAELLRVLDVIGHELAHMWFGDLVTMKWWDGIWLNEAFASFMEFKATDAMRPEWKRWLTFAAIDRPWALGVDALAATRPVEFEVGSPDEANEMFDALTYGKGSSLLRMIEQFIGEDSFRTGVGNYLRRHAYGNTVTEDLWAGLDEASEYPVGEIMSPWIHQRGFPQIEVSKTGSGLRFQQRRFFYLPDETDSTVWKVPLQVRGLRSGTEFWEKILLSDVEGSTEVGDVSLAVANAGGHGFYRVLYSPELIDAIVAHLSELEDLERFTIIDDAAAFVDSGQLSAADWMRLAQAYRSETEQAIWGSVLGGAAEIEHHLVEEENRPAFQDWVAKLVGPAFNKLGWNAGPGESDLTRRLRGQLAAALGRLAHDREVIDRCATLADQVLSDSRSIDPELAQAALLVTAHHGGEAEYRRYLEEYPKTRAPHEQQRLLLALAAFDHPDLVAETVDASLDGRIRTQDSAWVIGATLRNRINGPLAWKQLRRLWDKFVKLPTMTQRRAIEGIKSLSRPEIAAEVEAFFAETKLPHAAKSIAQNLEMLRVLVELRERETKSVKEFLAG
ncbi:MAG TPA: M1 family metallopeptidase [Acidimicrobiia bacterium]